MPAPRLLKRIAKWAGMLVLLAGALVLCAGAWIGFQLRASLAQLDGTRKIPGLAGPVLVERDELGVPTIRATNRVDAARALGFLHAQERFFQMDVLRRMGAGELAELLGPAVIPLDKQARRHQFRQRAQKAFDPAHGVLAREELAVLEAYTEGANAGLEALGAVPPEYLLLRVKPQPWRPEDCGLVAYAMFFGLQDDEGNMDRIEAVMRDLLPAEARSFFLPQGSSWDAAIDDSELASAPVPPASAIDFRTWTNGMARESPLAAGGGRDDPAPGSNSWAVDGRVSASGRAIVANDMHLDLRMPIFWFRVRLVFRDEIVGGQDLVGLTLPGAPAINVGSNGHVAWGFTNAYLDTTDLVRLEIDPDHPQFYRTPEGWKEMEVVTEEIRVRGNTNIAMRVMNTIWGPLAPAPGLRGSYAVSWVAHHPESVGVRLIALERARSVQDVLDAAPTIGMPLNNIVVGDREGNIGYTLVGRLPCRVGFDGSVPESWVDGSRRWEGLLSPREYPRLMNPPSGRLWTANNRVMGTPEYLRAHPVIPDDGARARQIRDGLRRLERAEEADLFAIYRDDRALFLERWQALMLDTVKRMDGLGTNRVELEKQLDAWGGRAASESVGYRLVRQFHRRVSELVFEPLVKRFRDRRAGWNPWGWLGETTLWTIIEQRPNHLLNPRFGTFEELLAAAVRDILRSLEDDGLAIPDATWGKQNTFHMRHPLSEGLPRIVSRWLDMPPAELPGDNDMPRVQGRHFGVTERLVVSPGREEDGLFNLPGGQSGHFLSPFYRAGHEAWMRAEPAPLLPGTTRHRLVLVPG